MEGWNVGTYLGGKNPKKGLISAKDLPIDSPKCNGPLNITYWEQRSNAKGHMRHL